MYNTGANAGLHQYKRRGDPGTPSQSSSVTSGFTFARLMPQMSILYDSRLLKRLCRAQYRLACLYLSFILPAPHLSSHTAIEQFQRIAVYLFAVFMTTAFDLTISVIHMATAFLTTEPNNAMPASIYIRSPVCHIYSNFSLPNESDHSFFSSTGAQYTLPSRIKYHRLPTTH